MRILELMASEQQAVCIIALLVLSLVLPVCAALRLQKTPATRSEWKRTVWAAQIVLGLSGIAMVALPSHAPAALVFAAIAVLAFALSRHSCPVQNTK